MLRRPRPSSPKMNESTKKRVALLLVILLVLPFGFVYFRSEPLVDYGLICERRINSGRWVDNDEFSLRCPPHHAAVASCALELHRSWTWALPALECGAQRRTRGFFQFALRGRRVVLAGDSIVRLLYVQFLRQMGADVEEIFTKKRADFLHSPSGDVTSQFLWRPYPENITEVLNTWDVASQGEPDVMIVGAGLWHALHIHSLEQYNQDLDDLLDATKEFSKFHPHTQFFLLSVSNTVTDKLKTEEKRINMNPHEVALYNNLLMSHPIMQPGGMYKLLDVHEVVKGCGYDCTEDGVHYHEAAYDALLQMWINILTMPWGNTGVTAVE